ncbi:MAG: hypothetical protein KF893_05415 [Caldilineaceae bacterium]|nr:hypothetical protein [Caldilineaceae bacterium]
MNPIPDRPATAYAPFFRPGISFITCWAVNGEPLFGQRTTAHLVRSVLREVKQRLAFTMLGFVILPAHLHLLIRPEDGIPVGQIVDRFLHRYHDSYLQVMGIPGEMEVWDRRRSIERVDDVDDFAHKLDLIHYDPVQHGLAARPELWESSSYGPWVERGLYKLGWGWQKPARLQGG